MKFKAVAENRKDIVKAMESLLNVKAIYTGPPTFRYEVGKFTVDRDGFVECESEQEGEWMKDALAEKGMAEATRDKLNIEMPLEVFTAESLKNLIFVIHSKQYLLERSVGKAPFQISEQLVEKLTDAEVTLEQILSLLEEEKPLGLEVLNGRVRFTGFPFTEDTAKVYTELVSQMVTVAKEQKRISPQQTIEENEKYYMRSWLVRLGFGGKEGKEVRQVLLANLKGHTAFRTEADREKWKAKNYGSKKGEKADE